MTTREYPARLRARIESRDAALQELGFRGYDHYLRSPEWQAVRVRHRAKYGEACGLCEVDKGRHQLHHMTYERVGREELHDLVLLCAKCHRMIHILEQRGDIGLDFAGLADMKRATEYATANLAREQQREREHEEIAMSPERMERKIAVMKKRVHHSLAQLPRDKTMVVMANIKRMCDAVEQAQSQGDDVARVIESFNS